MQIQKDDLIKGIQKRFNEAYPFLKIEFFKKSHPNRKPSPKSELINPIEPIGNLSKFDCSGFVDISGNRTVEMLENDFWEKFGLPVQVFRQSGNMWIETSLTDDWTLARQNYEGQQFSVPLSERKSLDDRLEDKRMDTD